jgi:HD superfamily phosphohydrolase
MANSKRSKRRQPGRPSTLTYVLRVRDLLHGYVHLTELEVQVVNHPLFQRLRHVRQNDVAFFVYPSLNTSRFEHSLGCAFVAGKMASNLVRSPSWDDYQQAVSVDTDTFEQICRLYALLHDVGHLPLSHLFELAFDDYVLSKSPNTHLMAYCEEWFGVPGFSKLHEACGHSVALKILGDINAPAAIRGPVLHLVANKRLNANDPLLPIKLLVDSEIDADRIDSTARDGLLAGGEYGTFDIERLCSSVYVLPHREGWCLGYSQKAVGPIEGLLLDRLRTHTRIHFHHRVAVMKSAARLLISSLLQQGRITKDSFCVDDVGAMSLRDDVWLWSMLRDMETVNDASTAARGLLLRREKQGVGLLWKRRSKYGEWQEKLKAAARVREIDTSRFGREYETWLSERLGCRVLVLWLRFNPIGKDAVSLTSDDGGKVLDELLAVSPLVASLEEMWQKEPQYYVILVGHEGGVTDKERGAWLEGTREWLSR